MNACFILSINCAIIAAAELTQGRMGFYFCWLAASVISAIGGEIARITQLAAKEISANAIATSKTAHSGPLKLRDEAITPDSRCPHCSRHFDRASGITAPSEPDAPTPTPGDFSVCIECGGWMVFTESLGVRSPTAEELATMDSAMRTVLTHVSKTIQVARQGAPRRWLTPTCRKSTP